MLTNDQITDIFCKIDDFCKDFYKTMDGHVLSKQKAVMQRNRKLVLSDSEVK